MISLASKISRARKMKVEAFPSNDIPTLVELAIDVVAENYTLYPSLDGVEEDHVRKEVESLRLKTGTKRMLLIDSKEGVAELTDHGDSGEHRLRVLLEGLLPAEAEELQEGRPRQLVQAGVHRAPHREHP